jgi:antagonist of KipI
MGVKLTKPGIYTTLQSLGSYGHRSIGVGPSGAMDPVALRLCNALLGNTDSAFALEMHFPAPEILFENETAFVLGGANFAAQLDGKPISNWRRHTAASGSTLIFRQRVKGSRAYLAVPDGFCWNSKPGIRSPRFIEPLQLNIAGASRSGLSSNVRISHALVPVYSRFPTIRILEGPDFEDLTKQSQETFYSEQFTVSNQSDRMGYRFAGPILETSNAAEMLSAAVCFGTLQLLPDGNLIALMADHQTTGGYPRVAQVITVDLPLLGQLGPGDKPAFHRIDLDEAERLAIQFERDLTMLRTAVCLNG